MLLLASCRSNQAERRVLCRRVLFLADLQATPCSLPNLAGALRDCADPTSEAGLPAAMALTMRKQVASQQAMLLKTRQVARNCARCTTNQSITCRCAA